MNGHTPGPWRLSPLLSGSENDRGFRIFASDGRDGTMWIADVSPVIDNDRGDASEEGKANARLIAAAPDLLEALKDVEANVADDSPFMWERVGAAIAKAEGK